GALAIATFDDAIRRGAAGFNRSLRDSTAMPSQSRIMCIAIALASGDASAAIDFARSPGFTEAVRSHSPAPSS
ncbi:hypothetical protein, partial [Mesorhizobium sp. M2D.F.Ca.ET.148.01.1.1]|uniref:hypothetical protein n=1 Tax=Mesorhizobium sp. M2D.F.Ca.ET.148.01.1.1 TaxID=2496665 RepID=UPI001AED670F